MCICKFDRVNQAQQNEHVNLISSAELCSLLADYLHALMNEFERFVEAAKEIIPGVDHKATPTLKRKRKKVVNDGNASDVSLNARDKFPVSTSNAIIYNLKAESS